GNVSSQPKSCTTTTPTSPCIDVTKTCPATAPVRTTSIPFSGVVSNCGDVPLTGVKVVDDNGTPGNPADDITINLPDIPVGSSTPYSGTHTVAAKCCGALTHKYAASGTGICGGNVSSQPKSCTTTVTTAPCLIVTKDCQPRT